MVQDFPQVPLGLLSTLGERGDRLLGVSAHKAAVVVVRVVAHEIGMRQAAPDVPAGLLDSGIKGMRRPDPRLELRARGARRETSSPARRKKRAGVARVRVA